MSTFPAASTDANGVIQAPTGTPNPNQKNGTLGAQIPIHLVAFIVMALGAIAF